MAKKIMVIDDEANILKVLESRLKSSGYDVTTAGDGKEGLEKIGSSAPDLIILDIMMPVMDGFEFFKKIRGQGSPHAGIPILMLTARGKMRDTFEMLEADDFVVKPFEADDLMQKVQYLLTKKALVLSQSVYMTGKVQEALAALGQEATICKDESELLKEGQTNKYKMVIVYLGNVTRPPKDFAQSLKTLRYRTPVVIAYCDADVPGAENDDAITLEGIARKWDDAGVKNFYDFRLCGKPFSDYLRNMNG